MEHVESSVKVYYTKDYSIFRALKGNRLLNEAKINRIIDDIRGGLDLLRYYPIVVDEKMNVIDGQHRLYVAKKLKLNVYYVIITRDLTLEEIAKVNSNTEKWNSKDFIHCYKANDNEHYTTLETFLDTYSFPLSVAQHLLMYGTAGNDSGNANIKLIFQQGKFKVSYKDDAERIAKAVYEFEHFRKFKTRPFIVAIDRLLAKGFDMKELATKSLDKIIIQPNYQEYIQLLTTIYNS